MDRRRRAITPERFAQGMTFDQYVAYAGSPENLAREAGCAMQVARPGESREQAWTRFLADWSVLQASPFPKMWASAAVDEMLSALHELAVAGSLA